MMQTNCSLNITKELDGNIMSYADLIRQEGEYTYSANIQFDITNDTKLLRFIPNETSVELFRDYFTDMTRNSPDNHARILYGSYGTGKSHFLTVLAQILEKDFVTGIAFTTFLDRIRAYDSALAHDIASFTSDNSRKPFLVVPIVFDFDDFDRCIYFSLKKKLDSIGVNIQYKTFFDQALALLDQWKSNEESNSRLNKTCKLTGVKIEKLEAALRNLDPRAEKRFNNLFEAMTFGVKFLYEASNMFEIINQTNDAITDRYAGIVFIFDEFGRYIEDNLKRIKVKSIQDLAEYCDHCHGNNHILLVSHKEISQYTEHYNKSVSTEWKKVEGRYKAFSINSKHDQSLDIIRSVLMKNEAAWESFKSAFSSELSNMITEAMDFGGYSVQPKDVNLYEAAFPLHPISLFVLDRLSKKVAQNDRTFFTYLAGNESNSLYRFLTHNSLNEFHYVGVDEIYNYFEPSIKSVQSEDAFDWYKKLESSFAKGQLDEYSDDIRVKVLKAIAAIGIINDPSAIIADKDTIIKAIDDPNDQIEVAIANLCDSKILKYSGIYQRYEFFDASIYDVSGMIEAESIRVSEDAVVKALNEHFVNFVLYPYEYNREYKINRVFVPIFSMANTISSKLLSQRIGKYYDGALVLMLGGNDMTPEALAALSGNLDRSIIWYNPESRDLVASAKKYIAAKYLETQKSKYICNDPAFEKELEYNINELTDAIEKELLSWRNFDTEDCLIAANGEVKNVIRTFTQIAELASDIMRKAYPETLIVNNELINKNIISGSITTAKKNAIRGMLQEENNQPYYGLQYLSPDYIAVRSVLQKNGFVSFEDNVTENALSDKHMPQQTVKEKISEYLEKASLGAVPFADLYTALKLEPFGLRDGYLSMLIASLLLTRRKTLIITSHGTEQELTAELFEEIIKRPGDYSFSIAGWNQEEQNFISELELLFRDKISPAKLNRNRLKAVYDGMMSHYKSVSKFARTTMRFVSQSTQDYRKLLEQNYTSYSRFFFESAKALTGDYESSLRKIADCRLDLDNALDVLLRELKKILCSTFALDFSKPLSETLIETYDEEWQGKRVKSFDYYTNAFLDYSGKIKKSDSDNAIISHLAKILTGIEIAYWSDDHRDEFETRLMEVQGKLVAYHQNGNLQSTETKMTLTTANGEEKAVVFDNTGLSDLGVTIKNKINSTFGNFGLAVTYDDKVQILLSLLSDLMEGK